MILGASLVPSSVGFDTFFHIGDMAFLDFHPLSPSSAPFHTFWLISTVDSHTLVWALELG